MIAAVVVVLALAGDAEASSGAPSSEAPSSEASSETPAAAEPVAAAPDPHEHRFGVAAVPTATFNTDEGFGTGGVVSIYHYYEDTQPYHDEFRFNVFVSSKLVQSHAFTWDGLKPFGIPGRSYLRVGYFSTVSQNYCGVGNVVDCSDGDAREAAVAEGLTDDPARDDDAFDTFARRYHLMRFIRPHGTVIFRPWLREKPWRTELLVGWRGSYTIPGDLTSRGPYPGSLYAASFPVGEEGLSSVPFVGVVVDDRDDEIFPERGVYAEASVRTGQAWTGSTWPHTGFNATAAGFFSMSREPRLVLATRGIVDVIVGTPSTEEMARVGGTLDPIAFGGSAIGRGVREHRYLGRVKLLGQTELRGQFVDVAFAGQDFSLGAALFSDYGFVGFDLADWRGRPLLPLATLGVSWRILWNRTFALRWDLATSPAESEGPGFYIIVGQVF